MRKLLYLLILFVLFTGRVMLGRAISFSRPLNSLVPGKRIRITERIPETPYQNKSTQTFKINGITVVAPLYPAYSYGDLVRIEGELKSNPSSSIGSLLSPRSGTLVLIYPSISLIPNREQFTFPQGFGFFWLGRLVIQVHNRLVRVLGEVLPEPHASLLAGIVVGERATMPRVFHEALQNTGTLHIIAVSGTNITIVAGVMVGVLVRLFSRRKAMVFAVIGIWGYVVLAGFSASVVRAAIMGTVAFVAVILGRERDAGRALVGTAVAMLLWNPDYIVDVGWELSFAATAGIVWGREVVKRWLTELMAFFSYQTPLALQRIRSSVFAANFLIRNSVVPPDSGGLVSIRQMSDRDSGALRVLTARKNHPSAFERVESGFVDELSVVFSAYVATLPLLVYHFGQLSWTAPIANLLIAPVVPVVTIGGGIVAIGGLVLGSMLPVRMLAWGVWPFLEYLVRVVGWFGRMGAWQVRGLPWWGLVLMYGVMIVGYWKLKNA